eukprot:837497-Pyramimonas_sp.AAC.2
MGIGGNAVVVILYPGGKEDAPAHHISSAKGRGWTPKGGHSGGWRGRYHATCGPAPPLGDPRNSRAYPHRTLKLGCLHTPQPHHPKFGAPIS